jgi:hypothetical protein
MSFFGAWMLFIALGNPPLPHPGLGPDAVIKTVAEALRNNDSPIPNAGIFTAYQFASPANHAVTGPYGRFLQIVKSDDSAPLFNAAAEEFDAIKIEGDHAEQLVRTRTAGGRVATYKFSVSRQREGPCRGCWMVDGVVRIP